MRFGALPGFIFPDPGKDIARTLEDVISYRKGFIQFKRLGEIAHTKSFPARTITRIGRRFLCQDFE